MESTMDVDVEDYLQPSDVSEIDKLNDDCLLYIFKCLTTVADKMRIERVCKKWQTLSQLSWNNFNALDFCFETWGIPGNNFFVVDKNIVEKLERLCGRFLTNVTLNLPAFRRICRSSQNLQELELFDAWTNCYEVVNCIIEEPHSIHYSQLQKYNFLNPCNCKDDDWQEIMKWLVEKCHNVTKFRLNLCHKYYKEEDIGSIFAVMKKLKTVDVSFSRNMDWNGTCLNQLSFDTIQEITLVSVKHVDSYLIASIIKKCKNLRKISLEEMERSREDIIFEAIGTHAESLKTLQLTRQFHFLQDSTDILLNNPEMLVVLSKLKSLEKLELHKFLNVNVQFLTVIGENCKQLTNLNLRMCLNVNDEGISALSNLKNLRILGLCGLHRLKCPPLEKFLNLEVIDCTLCSKLTDKSLCALFSKATKLRVINIGACFLLSSNVIKAAARAVETRSCPIPLKIYILNWYNLIEENYSVGINPALVKICDTRFDPIKYGLGTGSQFRRIPEILFYPHVFSEFQSKA